MLKELLPLPLPLPLPCEYRSKFVGLARRWAAITTREQHQTIEMPQKQRRRHCSPTVFITVMILTYKSECLLPKLPLPEAFSRGRFQGRGSEQRKDGKEGRERSRGMAEKAERTSSIWDLVEMSTTMTCGMGMMR